MGWFDDLKTRVEQEAGNAVKDIQSYIQNRAVDQVVKIAEEQRGNLSAAQIAQGQYGGSAPQAVAASNASATANATQASQIAVAGLSGGMLIAVAVGAYFLFSSKSRG